MTAKIAIIGECMLELSHGGGGSTRGAISMALSYGGDTLNTAVYLSRLGAKVDYVTALGDDNKSDWLVDQWRREGVGCDLVERYPDSVPGLYMIQTDEMGERTFLYWRDDAPVRRLLDDHEKSQRLFDKLGQYDWLYLSGITLALYRGDALDRLFGLLAEYRNGGGKIAFDGNYRPRLWTTVSEAQSAFEAVFRLSDIALPTLDDELMLFGDADRDLVVRRLQSWGVTEIVLKMGADGALVVIDSIKDVVESRMVTVVDTTSAGDSFNAGYLAERMVGSTPRHSAAAGHNLASIVIQHRGAIIPVEDMPTPLAL